MTCIAAITDGSTVWMAGERLATNESGCKTVRVTPKIARRGNYLLGVSGRTRGSDLLLFADPPPAPPKVAEDLHAFMATAFIQWALDVHEDNGFELRDKEGARTYEGNLLVGVRGRIYEVDGGYGLTLVDSYTAIGVGLDLALGALFATPGRPPEVRLRVALEAAERFNSSCGGAFDLLELGPDARKRRPPKIRAKRKGARR